jgi:hypothetical protein
MPNNSFMGTNVAVGNSGARSVIDEIMHLRTQVTRTDELRELGGWADPLNEACARSLERIRQTLALVTRDQQAVAPDGSSAAEASDGQRERQASREADAKNENLRLREFFPTNNFITADDQQMPPGHRTELPYVLDGSDPNYPQMSDPKFQNVFLKQFVAALDMAVRDCSNVASASFGDTLSPSDSVIVHARLEQAFAILQVKGGEGNMPIIWAPKNPESLTGRIGAEIVPEVVSDPTPNA